MRKYARRSLTIKSNANLASILYLEVVAVGLYCRTMSDKDRVSHNPWLSRAVAFRALVSVAATAGSKEAGTIAENGAAPGLVEGDPVFYF